MTEAAPTPTKSCLNCGAVVTDRFCAACGQKEGLEPKSVKVAFSEVLGNVFSYDNKLWRSLVLLCIKPGYLAGAFHEGKRMRYTNPLRLFLLMGVLVFFAPDTWTLEDYILPEDWTAPAAEGASLMDRFQVGAERLREFSRIEELQRRYMLDQALARSIVFSMTAGILTMALVMRLLHWRSYLVEHLVFGLHYASFICLSNLLLRLVVQDIGNTPAEAQVMVVLQAYWLLVGYQVRYGGKGWKRRLFPVLGAVVAFVVFTYPYGIVLQLTLIQMLMPPVA